MPFSKLLSNYALTLLSSIDSLQAIMTGLVMYTVLADGMLADILHVWKENILFLSSDTMKRGKAINILKSYYNLGFIG